MKLNLRHAVWALALAFTVAVLATPVIVAAQSEQGLEHGRGHDKNKDNAYANNPNYQQGWNHGQNDHAHNRARQYRARPENDADRRAYELGYDHGYQGSSPYIGQYGNRQYGQQSFQKVAYNNGFQEGLRYGQTDRSKGKSNQPTGSGVYGDGTKGYVSSYGDKSAYKNTFREGFRAGYAQGYGQRYNRGYRR